MQISNRYLQFGQSAGKEGHEIGANYVRPSKGRNGEDAESHPNNLPF